MIWADFCVSDSAPPRSLRNCSAWVPCRTPPPGCSHSPRSFWWSSCLSYWGSCWPAKPSNAQGHPLIYLVRRLPARAQKCESATNSAAWLHQTTGCDAFSKFRRSHRGGMFGFRFSLSGFFLFRLFLALAVLFFFLLLSVL